MRKTTNLYKYALILLLPLGILFNYLGSFFPKLVENIYSNKLYIMIGKAIGRITGLLPFSLGEFIVIFSIIFLFFFILINLYNFLTSLLKGNPKYRYILKKFMVVLIKISSVAYFTFITLWGLNYHRQPFNEISNLKIKNSSTAELKELCEFLVDRANELRTKVDEDARGVMILKKGYKDVFNRAQKGYDVASTIYPELKGDYGRPKGVFLSEALSYMGISGIYFPFTAEANVNVSIPHSMIPSTTAHEMAHQRGFAREDEANYIAYLTTSLHPDDDFKYSGTLLALIYAMNKLYEYDPGGYNELSSKYHPGLKRDLVAISKYWQKYDGPVEKASSKLNNTYLKANLQHDGIYSYGRMLDLLLAQRRRDKSLETNR